jgi:hypothetical protein
LLKKWPEWFTASDVAGMVNTPEPNDDEQALRDFLQPVAQPKHVFSSRSIGKQLKKHIDGPVRSGERTLVLRRRQDPHSEVFTYRVLNL